MDPRTAARVDVTHQGLDVCSIAVFEPLLPNSLGYACAHTVPSSISYVSVAPLIADAIRKL